ncbi:MAG: hypothetical protein JW950_07000 [Deltaproteobacteria bacterium]|nr:hypothetical protein [Deltaproteobacteria bacterium]
MKHIEWKIILGVLFVTLSAVVYVIHYLVFRDAHHIFIYLVGDIAFVFLEVLMVTLIIDEVLNSREKENLLQKMNMVIGTFFSEAGIGILGFLSLFDTRIERLRNDLRLTADCTDQEFTRLSRQIKQYDYELDLSRGNLETLKDLLLKHREFMLRLLENPNLLEHDAFTNLLMAVFHLTDELTARRNLSHLSEADSLHLATDMIRAYGRLLSGWLDYMQHLRKHYPYLYSFAMRTNPFDPEATVEFT